MSPLRPIRRAIQTSYAFFQYPRYDPALTEAPDG